LWKRSEELAVEAVPVGEIGQQRDERFVRDEILRVLFDRRDPGGDSRGAIAELAILERRHGVEQLATTCGLLFLVQGAAVEPETLFRRSLLRQELVDLGHELTGRGRVCESPAVDFDRPRQVAGGRKRGARGLSELEELGR